MPLSMCNCVLRNCVSAGMTNSVTGMSCYACIFHSNGTAGVSLDNGFTADNDPVAVFQSCIFYNNGTKGYVDTANAAFFQRKFVNCSFVSNTSDGLDVNQTANVQPLQIINCIFVSNGRYGINLEAGGRIRQRRISFTMYICLF